MHQRDAIGDRIHLFFACFGMIALFGPVTLTEIAFAPLAVFFVVRIFNTFPVWIHGFGQPSVLAALALGGWMMITLLWSPDRAHGWGEIGELRWFLLVGFIFPVIAHRKVLIWSMCVGVVLGQLAQVADAFDGFNILWLARLVENHPNRISGWWHPVIGGDLLVAAIGLWIPPALCAQGRTKIIAWLGLIGSSLALIATGTRGAWIAGVILITVSLLAAAGKGVVTKKQLLVVFASALAMVGLAWVIIPDVFESRINETKGEIHEMLNGQYDSYSGIRVQMAQTAIDEIIEHPLVGVGAGGYQQWSIDHNPESAVHAHAHNSVLQIWSTLGVVGVLLWTALIFAILRGAWLSLDRELDGLWGLSPMVAFVGLLLASISDSIQINTQSAAVLGALAALSPAYRPKIKVPQSDRLPEQHADQ